MYLFVFVSTIAYVTVLLARGTVPLACGTVPHVRGTIPLARGTPSRGTTLIVFKSLLQYSINAIYHARS
jgi:hypothetical protein